ncbi:hypothetical protein EH220_03890 [bacterium]|nr:MAG: hypothetical protein EH220_03890 [bacterium]
MANTPTGKARSRLNALKHGLRATDDIFISSLSIDDKEAYDKLLKSLHRDFAPPTELEKQLVNKLSILKFRQYRLYKMENLISSKSPEELLKDHSVLYHLDRFSRYDLRIEKQIQGLINQLKAYQILRHHNDSDDVKQ